MTRRTSIQKYFYIQLLSNKLNSNYVKDRWVNIQISLRTFVPNELKKDIVNIASGCSVRFTKTNSNGHYSYFLIGIPKELFVRVFSRPP